MDFFFIFSTKKSSFEVLRHWVEKFDFQESWTQFPPPHPPKKIDFFYFYTAQTTAPTQHFNWGGGAVVSWN